MRQLLSVIIILVSHLTVSAQGFWFTTRDFPGGNKTTFAGIQDSILFVGTENGIWRSENEGYSWTKLLKSSHVYSLYASRDTIVAGGIGKLFVSFDKGIIWDSLTVPSKYPILKIVENINHDYFIIANGFTNEEGSVGNGVFYSEGDLRSWEQRNIGLPANLSPPEHLAVDKNGRVYILLPDENTTGKGGLYFSDDNGLNWKQSDLVVNNLGTIKVLNSLSISITPQDSVVVSVVGTVVNFSVKLNVIKHINDIANNSSWRAWRIRKSGDWWDDRNLNSIHFAKNGDWYSSVNNSINIGGPVYSTDNGMNWMKATQGMGVSATKQYESNFHVESSSGKVFMVQLLDERVYYTNQSLLNPVALSGNLRDDQGNVLAGVTITAKNTLAYSNGEGNFSVILPVGWSGTLKPELKNYVFNRESFSVASLQGSSGSLNFMATYIGTYFISGTVTDVSGQPIAQIPISGFPDIVYTNELGYYVAEVPAQWSGSITPIISGYQSNPVSITLPEVRSNLLEQNFILRKAGMVYVTGQVKDEKGDPFTAATITGFPETTSINSEGRFYGEIPVGWSGTIIPVAEGFTFMPDKIQVVNLQNDLHNQVFVVASTPVVIHRVSGLIKDESGSPLNNISLTGLPNEIKTLLDGSYYIELPEGWSGIIAPISENFIFSPASLEINDLFSSLSNLDFIASLVTEVEDPENNPFNIYPNPSSDGKIYIETNAIVGVKIINSIGQIVWSGFSNDLSEAGFELPTSGIFFVTLFDRKTTRTIKVMRQ